MHLEAKPAPSSDERVPWQRWHAASLMPRCQSSRCPRHPPSLGNLKASEIRPMRAWSGACDGRTAWPWCPDASHGPPEAFLPPSWVRPLLVFVSSGTLRALGLCLLGMAEVGQVNVSSPPTTSTAILLAGSELGGGLGGAWGRGVLGKQSWLPRTRRTAKLPLVLREAILSLRLTKTTRGSRREA